MRRGGRALRRAPRTAGRSDLTFLCVNSWPFAPLVRCRGMSGFEIRGDQKSRWRYLVSVRANARRAERARGAGRNVLVLAVRDGSCSSERPPTTAAHAAARAGEAKSRGQVCGRPIQTGMRPVTVEQDDRRVERTPRRIRGGGSRRGRYSKTWGLLQKFSAQRLCVGLVQVDHTREDGGVPRRRRTRPTDKAQRRRAHSHCSIQGGTEAAAIRQPGSTRQGRSQPIRTIRRFS